jgi:hypothetical protein
MERQRYKPPHHEPHDKNGRSATPEVDRGHYWIIQEKGSFDRSSCSPRDGGDTPGGGAVLAWGRWRR